MINRILMAASAAVLFAAAPATAVIYTINVGDSTLGATGFIETDGTLGIIAEANIINWEFNLADNGVNFTLNGPTNSGKLVEGDDLTATATGLFFNFSGTGLALFQNPATGSGINFICIAATNGCDGFGNGFRITTDDIGDGIPQTGLQQIGTASGGTVPEPASWAMLIAGFGLIGAVARRRSVAVAS